MRAGVTDHIPSEKFAATLMDVTQPVWKIDNGGPTVQSSDDGKVQRIQGPHTSGKEVLPIGFFDNAQKTRVKSSLVYFAESYRAIRTGDFPGARSLLLEASQLYDFSLDELGYLLPYYAFAAAKTGDVTTVEKYIADYSSEQKSFDYFLAKAIISGIGGKLDESLRFLKNALYRRPFTENRSLQTEYQYAEIIELLYEATGKTEYKKLALDWAKKNQKFQPWFAWAYAMEAKLSSDEIKRNRALAMAAYLDPQSYMLGQISKQEIEAAVREFKGKNPFLNMHDTNVQAPI